jgi:hypothetical protein
MPIVTQCTAPGCETLTMGPLCVDHDAHVERLFVRGRPFPRPDVELHSQVMTTTTTSFAASVRTASEPAAAVPLLR